MSKSSPARVAGATIFHDCDPDSAAGAVGAGAGDGAGAGVSVGLVGDGLAGAGAGGFGAGSVGLTRVSPFTPVPARAPVAESRSPEVASSSAPQLHSLFILY